MAGGKYPIESVYDGGLNFKTSTDKAHTLTVDPATTQPAAEDATTTFSTSAQVVPLTATVTSPAGTVNEGTETFTILSGTTVIGSPVTVNVTAGAASASYALPAGTPAGTYTIQAVYSGTTNFRGYTDNSQSLIVSAAASATAAASASVTFSGSAQAVALSATGHYKEAIAEIVGASAAQPKNPFGLSFRGRVEAFAGNYANAAGWFERAREADPASSQNALLLAQVYDRLGRVDEAIKVLEDGRPQWRSVPAIRFWLGLSDALAGHKEQAAAEFSAFRALAPKWTLSTTKRFWARYYTPQFADRIVALSGEYGIPDK